MRFSARLFKPTAIARPFFVTTPIFYVNAAPHLGHVYSAVVADAAARLERLLDPDCRVLFSSGTDEHGTKVQQAAAKHNLPPRDYCNSISAQYQELFRECSVEYTDFVRTTEERHKKAVHHFWNELKQRDWIYKSQYSGWYSVSDETFVPESQLRDDERDGRRVKVYTESGHAVEWTEETNYMFRLSAFREHLQDWLRKDGVVTPHKYQEQLREMLSRDAYLPDISVSRPAARVHWAIPVPDDEQQTVYVWLDALVSYLTVAGYPDYADSATRARTWPADLHVIGKDILKFHGLYWPAFLMAAGLHPPRRLLCHAHWTVDAQKMSKSLGNVVAPRDAPGGLDALRYFLLREGTMHSDANYSETKLVRVVNSELADTLGNLLSRCTGAALNPSQEVPALEPAALSELRADSRAAELLALVDQLPDVCRHHYSSYQFYKVADATVATLHAANGWFESRRPWELRRAAESAPQLAAVLHVTLETLRVCGLVLQPLAPRLAAALLRKLQVPPERRAWRDAEETSWSRGGRGGGARPLHADKLMLFQRILPADRGAAAWAAAEGAGARAAGQRGGAR